MSELRLPATYTHCPTCKMDTAILKLHYQERDENRPRAVYELHRQCMSCRKVLRIFYATRSEFESLAKAFTRVPELEQQGWLYLNKLYRFHTHVAECRRCGKSVRQHHGCTTRCCGNIPDFANRRILSTDELKAVYHKRVEEQADALDRFIESLPEQDTTKEIIRG